MIRSIRDMHLVQDRPAPLPRLAGQAVFGVFVVFVAVGIARRASDDPAAAVTGGAMAIAFGALAVLGPRRLLLPAAFAATAGVVLIAHGEASNIGWFGLVALAGWCALSAPAVIIGTYWLAAMLLLAGEAIFVSHDPGWAAWIGGTCFSVVGCLFGRRQRELAVELREAQAGLVQHAQEQERSRIARELHDVIAHSLTVSLLHVSSARLSLRDDPDDAARALAEAERLGRASLDEVRHAVGLLHPAGGAHPTSPLPGSSDVPRLIEGFRAAGADVRASIDGDLQTLPATVGLATYRIMQEALTNAVKHAPQTPITVHLAATDPTVRLDIDSAGRPGSGHGLGLIGMRERAEALGGRLEAGPGGSGWRVHAELPARTNPQAHEPPSTGPSGG